MNKLTSDRRAAILTLLCEGSSLRSISRITGVSLDTVTKFLVDAGRVCRAFHDEAVRNIRVKRTQCDETSSCGVPWPSSVSASASISSRSRSAGSAGSIRSGGTS